VDGGRGSDGTAARGPALVVVADLLVRQQLVEGLAAAGFEPVVAAGPGALRERLDRVRPAVVLVDLELRTLDPIEAIRQLKDDAPTAGVPVLGVAGHRSTVLRERALAAGCDRVATRGEAAARLDRLLARLVGAPGASSTPSA